MHEPNRSTTLNISRTFFQYSNENIVFLSHKDTDAEVK